MFEVVERRESTGRFGRVFDDHSLVVIVRDVCRYLTNDLVPARPLEQVTQTVFDDHRAAAGWPNAPRAWRIAKQLQLSWPDVRALAVASDREMEQRLANPRRRNPTQPTLEGAVWSQQQIARRLEVKTLTPSRYEAERLRVEKSDAHKWRHGGKITGRLLTYAQIEANFGWQSSLREAGLESAAFETSERGMRWTEVLEMFLLELGYLPTSLTVLRRYGHEKGIAVATRGEDGTHSIRLAIDEVRAKWESLGRWFPPRSARPKQRPPWNVTPLASSDKPAARRKAWTFEGCEASLDKIVDELAGERITQRSYRAHSKGRRDLAPIASITKIAKDNGTSFPKMRAAALRRRAARLNADVVREDAI